MTASNKDSAEIVEFMSLFAKVKDCCDDDAPDLPSLANDDPALSKLCMDLFFASLMLTMNEKRRRELFASPVDPKFLAAWRDYESRYAGLVVGAVFGSAGIESANEPAPFATMAERHWKTADNEAKEQADAIEGAINFADDQASDSTRGFPDEFPEQIAEGFAAWQRLKKDAGFDLRGVFRRRAAVPFVLIPRHVAAKENRLEALSMLSNLQQAHDAFVFGVPHAALAMMRSIMETVLRDHYKAEGETLPQRIGNAAKRLPAGANVAALHRLRKLANSILHLDRDGRETMPKLAPEELEKEILSLLFVLRALIEGTPRW